MELPVLTAVAGAWEAPVVGALERSRSGVVVVRRCVDLADLLAAAAAGQARAVLLSADLHRLDREALSRLEIAGLAVVGMAPADDAGQAGKLRALGVAHVVAADAPAGEIVDAVTAAVRDLEHRVASGHTGTSDPALSLGRAPSLDGDGDGPAADGPGGPGRVVAVWGPIGAPGRTTVAVTVAAELAALSREVLLVDADTYGASVAQVLGVLDEAPGVAAACRAASAGTLDEGLLARLAPVVSPRLRVLTGIPRPSRWPELGAAGLEVLWQVVRGVAAWTVVDCGFALERDEELVYDTVAPRRNAATLTALAAADVVLAVGAADPVGLQRLVRGLDDLAEASPGSAPRVVVTRVRGSAVGSSPRRRIVEALGRYAGVENPVLVPDDREACDAALLAGRTLAEHAPSSPARAALADLAAELEGVAPSGRASRRPRLSRR